MNSGKITSKRIGKNLKKKKVDDKEREREKKSLIMKVFHMFLPINN